MRGECVVNAWTYVHDVKVAIIIIIVIILLLIVMRSSCLSVLGG